MKVTDEMLYQRAPEAERMILDALPGEDMPEAAFSEEFEQKVKQVVVRKKSGSRQKWYLRASAAAILCLVLYGIGETSAFSGLYERIYQFAMVCFSGVDTEKEGTETECTVGYLPEGMNLTETSRQGESLWIYTWKDEQGGWLILRRELLSGESEQKRDILSEGRIETELVNGVLYWKIREADSKGLLWEKDGNIFYLEGNMNEDVLIQIAENIKIE